MKQSLYRELIHRATKANAPLRKNHTEIFRKFIHPRSLQDRNGHLSSPGTYI